MLNWSPYKKDFDLQAKQYPLGATDEDSRTCKVFHKDRNCTDDAVYLDKDNKGLGSIGAETITWKKAGNWTVTDVY